jgi:hypothetical protein
VAPLRPHHSPQHRFFRSDEYTFTSPLKLDPDQFTYASVPQFYETLAYTFSASLNRFETRKKAQQDRGLARIFDAVSK